MSSNSPNQRNVRFRDLYTEICKIGHGSFGEVLKVRRNEDSKTLVCKVLSYGLMSEREKQLVVSEVNILRELRHPNIVRYYDRFIDKRASKLYILMEYCQGGDLGKHIKRKRRERSYFDEARIWRALAQLLLAFEECHMRKEGSQIRPILHRDIKPCNVFLDGAGNIKVGDFGLAKELGGENRFAYTNVGTPYYMSPELINHNRYNEKSDVWSIGCLIFEMAALRPPFEAHNVVALGNKITKGKFERIPSRYSNELQQVIEAMLQLNPVNRPSVTQLMTVPRLSPYIAASKSSALDSSPTPQIGTSNSGSLEEKLRQLRAKEEELKKRERQLEEKEEEYKLRIRALEKREQRVDEKRDELRKMELSIKQMQRRSSTNSIENNNDDKKLKRTPSSSSSTTKTRRLSSLQSVGEPTKSTEYYTTTSSTSTNSSGTKTRKSGSGNSNSNTGKSSRSSRRQQQQNIENISPAGITRTRKLEMAIHQWKPRPVLQPKSSNERIWYLSGNEKPSRLDTHQRLPARGHHLTTNKPFR